MKFHLLRNSLRYVSYKDRKAVAADLKLIYTSSTEAEVEQQLKVDDANSGLEGGFKPICDRL